MRYRIDIWDTDRSFYWSKVDPELHHGLGPSQNWKEKPPQTDITLTDYMLISCNAAASIAKTDYSGYDAPVKARYEGENIMLDGVFDTQRNTAVSAEYDKRIMKINAAINNLKKAGGHQAEIERKTAVQKELKTVSEMLKGLKAAPKKGNGKSIKLEVSGYLYKAQETYEDTRRLARWANENSKNAEVKSDNHKGSIFPPKGKDGPNKYRKVLLRVMNHKKHWLIKEHTYRLIYLSCAFVSAYTESYDVEKGVGTFAMTIEQKADEIGGIVIDAPEAKASLWQNLASWASAGGRLLDNASNLAVYTSSAIMMGYNVAKGLGFKSKGFEDTMKRITDVSSVIGGVGGVLNSAGNRKASFTERANKTAESLNQLTKNSKQVDEDFNEKEYKENQAEEAAKDAVKQENETTATAAYVAAVKKAKVLENYEKMKENYSLGLVHQNPYDGLKDKEIADHAALTTAEDKESAAQAELKKAQDDYNAAKTDYENAQKDNKIDDEAKAAKEKKMNEQAAALKEKTDLHDAAVKEKKEAGDTYKASKEALDKEYASRTPSEKQACDFIGARKQRMADSDALIAAQTNVVTAETEKRDAEKAVADAQEKGDTEAETKAKEELAKKEKALEDAAAAQKKAEERYNIAAEGKAEKEAQAKLDEPQKSEAAFMSSQANVAEAEKKEALAKARADNAEQKMAAAKQKLQQAAIEGNADKEKQAKAEYAQSKSELAAANKECAAAKNNVASVRKAENEAYNGMNKQDQAEYTNRKKQYESAMNDKAAIEKEEADASTQEAAGKAAKAKADAEAAEKKNDEIKDMTTGTMSAAKAKANVEELIKK